MDIPTSQHLIHTARSLKRPQKQQVKQYSRVKQRPEPSNSINSKLETNVKEFFIRIPRKTHFWNICTNKVSRTTP